MPHGGPVVADALRAKADASDVRRRPAARRKGSRHTRQRAAVCKPGGHHARGWLPARQAARHLLHCLPMGLRAHHTVCRTHALSHSSRQGCRA